MGRLSFRWCTVLSSPSIERKEPATWQWSVREASETCALREQNANMSCAKRDTRAKGLALRAFAVKSPTKDHQCCNLKMRVVQKTPKLEL